MAAAGARSNLPYLRIGHAACLPERMEACLRRTAMNEKRKISAMAEALVMSVELVG
jgi:hypothetical protein